MSVEVEVRAVRAGFGDTEVLRGVDLRLTRGSLTAVLGPSGCGKTTLLRVLAGFHQVDSGTVVIDGRVVDDGRHRVAPERRRVAVVPQEGALFPHLTALGNIEYGLSRAERRGPRATDMLELVGLAGHGGRFPHELSGGQQQRVAVARALAPGPDVVTLDEPFSALDAHLREELRRDVRELIRAEGATALLVTHDQGEALALADEVAVMHEGVVVQQGSPHDVYQRPATAWVAGFVGDATILSAETGDDGSFTTELGPVVAADGARGTQVLIRPEQLVESDHGAEAVVESVEFHGHSSIVVCRLVSGTRLVARASGRPPTVGARWRLAVDGPVWALPG